jgi:hypothetical protein
MATKLLRSPFRSKVSNNNYFSRNKHAGQCAFHGKIEPSFNLFNGRLTFTFHAHKSLPEGTTLITHIEISDDAGHGPFKLVVKATVTSPREKTTHQPPTEPTVEETPSRPDIVEVPMGPFAPPLTIERIANTTRLQLQINKDSHLLSDAKKLRLKEEEAAVEFVFKYGLALIAMGLLDAAKKTPAWKNDDEACRKSIQDHAAGIARVIVPLCLTLPKKLPKAALVRVTAICGESAPLRGCPAFDHAGRCTNGDRERCATTGRCPRSPGRPIRPRPILPPPSSEGISANCQLGSENTRICTEDRVVIRQLCDRRHARSDLLEIGFEAGIVPVTHRVKTASRPV